MTANQIAFNRSIEDARHNRVIEGIEKHKAESTRMGAEASLTSAEASRSQASTAAARQVEDARHNVEDESIRRGQLQVSSGQLEESHRANVASETIRKNQLEEEKRHNLAQESIGSTQASASIISAKAQQQQASVASLRQAEDARHNLVAEGISERMTTAQEDRTESEAKLNNAKMYNLQVQNQLNQRLAERVTSEKFKNYTSVLSGLANALLR